MSDHPVTEDPETELPSAALENLRALQAERARARELEVQLDAIRSSESFRVGHALISLRRRVAFWRHDARRARPTLPPAPAAAAPSAGGRRHHPGVRGVLAVALDADVGGEIGEELELLKLMFATIVPVVMTDATRIDPAYGDDVAIEHVIPLEEWRRARPAIDWGPYVAERIRRTMEEYGVDTIVAICSHDAETRRAQLSAILTPVALPGMAESEINLIE